MLVIDENKNIQVSQYDTFSIRFRFSNYKLTNADKVVFAIKKTTNSSEVVYTDTFYNPNNNFVDVVVPKGALDSLEPGAYIYDLAIMNSETERILTCFFTKSFIIKGGWPTMSDAANVEVTLMVQNNTEVELGDVADGYAADQARAYRDKAGEYAADALNSKNMAEAWAESDSAPAGEGTRSSKSWSEVSRQWAESNGEPDGVTGARSAKSWSETARAWAESDGEPDGVTGAKSAKSWATVSSQKATEAEASAQAADTSAKASSGSAAEAKTSQQEATTQATLARQSATSAAEKLAQMQINLKVKADVDSPVLTGTPVAPTPANNAQGTQIANVAYVKQMMAELINGSDASLDTLKELADALGNDPNFATTIMGAIGKSWMLPQPPRQLWQMARATILLRLMPLSRN